MGAETVENKMDGTVEQTVEFRKLGTALRYFLIADVAVILFLTFGFVFPTKIGGPGSRDGVFAASEYQGKSSPLEIRREPAAEPRTEVPRFSARTYPLPSPVPINASLTLMDPGTGNVGIKPAAVSPADAEANLTMRKRTT